MFQSESENVINQLKFLSLCINKKCNKLSKSPPKADSLKAELLKLCESIKKNCDVFENKLRGGVPNNILIVELNLLDIIGEERCKDLKEDEVGKFKKDLERFSKTYLTDSRDPVLGNLYRLFYSDPNSSSADSSINQDITSNSNVESAVREIFGSDVEEVNSNPSNDRQSSSEKTCDKEIIPYEADAGNSSKDANTSVEKIHIISQVSLPNQKDTSLSILDKLETIDRTERVTNKEDCVNESVESGKSEAEKNLPGSQEGSTPVNSSSDVAKQTSEKTSSDTICPQEFTELPSSSQGEIEAGSPKSAQKIIDSGEVALSRENQQISQTEGEKISLDLPEEDQEHGTPQNTVDDGNTASQNIADDLSHTSQNTVDDGNPAPLNIVDEANAAPQNIVDEGNAAPQNIVEDSDTAPQNNFDDGDSGPQTIVEDSDTAPQNIVEDSDTAPQNNFDDGDSGPQTIVEDSDTAQQNIIEDGDSGSQNIIEDGDSGPQTIVEDSDTAPQNIIDDGDSGPQNIDGDSSDSVPPSIVDVKAEVNSLVDSTAKQQNEVDLPVEEGIDRGGSSDHSEVNMDDEEQHDAEHVVVVETGLENSSHCASVESTSYILPSEDKNTEAINADGEHCTEIVESSSQHSTSDSENSNLVNKDQDENDEAKSKFFADLGLSKTSNVDKIRTIRDELMEMFAEVSCEEDERGFMVERTDIKETSSDSSDEEDKYSESKVAAALRELEEDSSSDIELQSESDIDLSSFEVDSLLSDTEDKVESSSSEKEPDGYVDEFVPKRCSVILERKDLEKMRKELGYWQPSMESEGGAESNSQEFAIKECSVLLEPLGGEEKSESVEKPVDEDAVINRLCQLSTLENKRRTAEGKPVRRKIKRRKRELDLSGSETSDLSGYSTVSEEELKKERLLEAAEDHDDNIPIDPNTLLAEIVCHTIHDSDSDSSTDPSSDEEERKSRRKNDGGKKKEEGAKKEKGPSWKDDPLLRGNLNVPSEKERKSGETSRKRSRSSDDEMGCNERKKIRHKTRNKYLDPNYSDTSSYDSSDDFEDTPKVKTNKIKHASEDSDIEYIGSTSNNVINIDSDEETDKKNCRRNILSVLSSKSLTESTQKAAKEEEDRVMRLEEQRHMRSSQETMDSEVEGIVLDVSKDGSKIVVDPNLSRKLFAHQIEGVKFMWDACYLSVDTLQSFKGTGCILAHNMGLGKTLQVVTLVHTLFNHPVTKTKHVLVVCPLSTVSSWKKEFLNALKMVQCKRDIKIITVESRDDCKTKQSMVIWWKNMTGVLIVGYEAFCRLTKEDGGSKLVREALVDPGPDLVVCDEGHLLKNGKTLRTRALMQIKTKRRIALTGTPLQNNLNEYYYMVQFVKPNLLGTKNEFSRQFVNPIMNGQYEDSLEHDITLMKKRTHVLHRLLKNTVQRYEATELHKYLENMKDYALFIQLHPVQEKLYRSYLQMVTGRRNDNMKKTIKSFFVDYQILKFICSHPQLLHTMEETQNIQRKKGAAIREHEVIYEEAVVHEVEGVPQDWWKSECSDEIKTNIEFGTKLQVMMAIIEEAEKKGEKVLIFTSSLVELSSVEFFLKLRGTASCSAWKSKVDYFRMDGTVPPSVRTEMCDLFNDESNRTLRVFLMSHNVGGLGLNLVAANRVILLGANFNPSLDSQSIYRAYRFGQKKNVYIYRLLSMGTMEEKIYNRGVTKLAVASRVVDKHQIARHYKNLDLEDLYKVEIDLSLQRNTPAKPDDDILSTILLKFECIHKYHHHQKLLENRPDEELNEEDQKKAWEEFEQMNEKERNPPAAPAPPSIPNIVQNIWNQINRPQPSGSVTQADPTRSTLPRPNMTTVNPPRGTIARRMSLNGPQPQQSQSGPLDLSAGGAKNRPTTASHQQFSTNVPPRLIPIDRKKVTGIVSQLKNVNVNQRRKSVAAVPNGKPKASAIGPNPFVLARTQRRKENVATSAKPPTWRTFSSDDFQKKPGTNSVKRTVRPDVLRNDNVVIDISDDTNDKETAGDAIEKQLAALRSRNLTVTKKPSGRSQATMPPVIDIT